MVTFTLTDGYDRSKNPARITFRAMTAEEAKGLRAGTHVQFWGKDGKVYRAKVNGAGKTWKRNTARVEVSLKYGLYEYFTARATENGRMTLLLVPVTADQPTSQWEDTRLTTEEGEKALAAADLPIDPSEWTPDQLAQASAVLDTAAASKGTYYNSEGELISAD